jgi:hypothetical protein
MKNKLENIFDLAQEDLGHKEYLDEAMQMYSEGMISWVGLLAKLNNLQTQILIDSTVEEIKTTANQ